MSAAVLREAAALMRERAEAARAGRWAADGDEVVARWSLGDVDVATCRGSIDEGNEINAEHIASWDPAVALAVADWLDAEAACLLSMQRFADITVNESAEMNIRGAALTITKHDDGAIGLRADTSGPALAVARAYLGTTP